MATTPIQPRNSDCVAVGSKPAVSKLSERLMEDPQGEKRKHRRRLIFDDEDGEEAAPGKDVTSSGNVTQAKITHFNQMNFPNVLETCNVEIPHYHVVIIKTEYTNREKIVLCPRTKGIDHTAFSEAMDIDGPVKKTMPSGPEAKEKQTPMPEAMQVEADPKLWTIAGEKLLEEMKKKKKPLVRPFTDLTGEDSDEGTSSMEMGGPAVRSGYDPRKVKMEKVQTREITDKKYGDFLWIIRRQQDKIRSALEALGKQDEYMKVMEGFIAEPEYTGSMWASFMRENAFGVRIIQGKLSDSLMELTKMEVEILCHDK